MAGIGVITNPRSRRNKKDPRLAQHLGYVLGERGQAHAPPDLDALEWVARTFYEHEIELVCVNGGDGTLHHAVSALARVYGERPLPRIALLRGGTMNTIARGIGLRGRPAEILEDVVSAYHAGVPLPVVTRWTMVVDDHRFGFLFGTGLMSVFLEEYYRTPDPSPLSAGWVLARAVGSALVRGEFARRMFDPTRCEVAIDGEILPRERWMSVSAGTVDQIGLGFTPYYRAPTHPGRMHALAFACTAPRLVAELPRIWQGRPTRSPDIFDLACAAIDVRAEEPIGYMMDGDFFRGGRELRVRIGPPVEFVVPALVPA